MTAFYILLTIYLTVTLIFFLLFYTPKDADIRKDMGLENVPLWLLDLSAAAAWPIMLPVTLLQRRKSL